jgi:hypothetical protein
MEFEKGGVFEVCLYEDVAPKTCKAFMEKLPYEADALQARFAGEEFFYKMPLEVGAENQKHPVAGSIAYNADRNWQAICIYYGPKIKAANPFNLIGELKGDLKELQKIGYRIWKEGKETVKIKAAD